MENDALSLASARLSKLLIPFLNSLLDRDLCKHFFDFPIISFYDFHSWFYHIHQFYLYFSFKHSNWGRHKLGHT